MTYLGKTVIGNFRPPVDPNKPKKERSASRGPRFLDLTSHRFGRLVVTDLAGFTKFKQARWNCLCDCGRAKIVQSSNLRSGHVTSCGCYSQEIRERAKSHGYARKGARHSEYSAWAGMKRRCNNPKNVDFKDYGGRGIMVCDRWRDSFNAFLTDMGRKPSPKHSIDRINVDGNYEPSNCRWATPLEQRSNRRDAGHRPKRIRERNGNCSYHLANIRRLPSCLSGQGPCEAHHLRFGPERGVGMKATDRWAIPLTAIEHRLVHTVGGKVEEAWFAERGVDCYLVANALWKAKGNLEAMKRIVEANIPGMEDGMATN